MISEDSIKAIKSQNSFSELRSHILSEINEINSVNGLENLSNASAGEEVKIRAKVVDKLIKIFRPFVEFGEKKGPSVEDVQKAKERTGL